ncbi:MAG: FAD-binding protein [Bacteroidetes bacterium]|nr:MAG: FAD-binding protein [Bacteroidota bacterium]
MSQTCTINLPPEQLDQPEAIRQAAAQALGCSPREVVAWQILRRSIDARRRRRPHFVLRLEVWDSPRPEGPLAAERDAPNVASAPEVHIVGMGPGGLFAALELIQLGYKPVLIDRGKAVRPRRRDLAAITREGRVDPDSNYCFGEGGAGTFSDGKLYTRSTKRGDTRRALETLVQFGATPDILVDAHPHIGTNKLPKIIEQMRAYILACGGEIHFQTRLTGLRVEAGVLKALQIRGDTWLPVQALILATGHSARDVFRLLYETGIAIEAKPFALGLRVEHPQALIDQIQYHCGTERHPNLPAAAYSLVRQVEERGVYSFCMCPGGIICPAATAEGEVVVNGWSPSKRNSPYANSGMVVELQLSDFPGVEANPLAAMDFQSRVEQQAFAAGGGRQVAPAQRLTDFVKGRLSTDLPGTSYLPGIRSVELGEVLPDFIYRRMQQGFRQFGRMMKGYLTEEAVVLGVESRTSSPVRIPRDRLSRQHPRVAGLFPCGEGAGYAGGIMSAALDGEACARAAVATLAKK